MHSSITRLRHAVIATDKKLFGLAKQAVRKAATICPRPLQWKRAAAALSQVGRAGSDKPIRAIPADRPHKPPAGRMYATDVRRRQTDVRQTDVRQHHRLMLPPMGRGIIMPLDGIHVTIVNVNVNINQVVA